MSIFGAKEHVYCNDVPTQKWLLSLKALKNSFGNDGLIVIAQMLKDKQVIVKVLKSKFEREATIVKLVREHQNVVTSYCMFMCKEDETKMDMLYPKNSEFCSATGTESILIHIMKKYPHGDLDGFRGMVTIHAFRDLLCQGLATLIELYGKFGLTHNDVHMKNILLEFETDDPKIYRIGKKTITVRHTSSNRVTMKLTDFGNALLGPSYELQVDPHNKVEHYMFPDKHLIIDMTRMLSSLVEALHPKTKKDLDDKIASLFAPNGPVENFQHNGLKVHRSIYRYMQDVKERDVDLDSTLQIIKDRQHVMVIEAFHYAHVIYSTLFGSPSPFI